MRSAQMKDRFNASTRVGIRDRVPGIPQSRSRKSGTGTGTGTHFKIRDWDRDSNSKFSGSGTGTGTEFEKSGTRDWDRDASKNLGPEPGLTIFSSGNEILSNRLCPKFNNISLSFFHFQNYIYANHCMILV